MKDLTVLGYMKFYPRISQTWQQSSPPSFPLSGGIPVADVLKVGISVHILHLWPHQPTAFLSWRITTQLKFPWLHFAVNWLRLPWCENEKILISPLAGPPQCLTFVSFLAWWMPSPLPSVSLPLPRFAFVAYPQLVIISGLFPALPHLCPYPPTWHSDFNGKEFFFSFLYKLAIKLARVSMVTLPLLMGQFVCKNNTRCQRIL